MKFIYPKINIKNFHFKTAWCAVLMLLTLSAWAQQPTVSARIDKPSIILGDQLYLLLNATYNPLTHRVQFPSLNDTFNHIEVLERPKLDSITKGDLIELTQKVKITSFDSGRWEIPSLAFTIQPLNGDSSSSIASTTIFLDVQSPVVDTSQPFKPIMAIREAKMPLKEIITYLILGVILLIGIIALLVFLYRKWKASRKKEIAKPKEPILLPHEKALQALQNLETKQLWQNGEGKRYHTELSDILRAYLEDQFSIDCFEKTTSEIVYQVKRVRVLTAFRQPIRDALTLSDMVKFAKAKPLAEEHTEMLETIRTFIVESYKKVKSAETKPENQSE